MAACFSTGDYGGALTVCHPDIEMQDWHLILGAPDAPEDWYQGLEGAGRWVAEWLELASEPRIEPEDFMPVDKERLVITGMASGAAKRSEVSFEVPWAAVFTMRDGKVARMALFRTKAEALEAVGLSE